jgi:acetyltransferase-like isoleucine patch superfamily enzyme
MLETLLEKLKAYNGTCSITNPKNGCVTFARHEKHLNYLKGVEKDIMVIAPKESFYIIMNLHKSIKSYLVDYPEYTFTLYHNKIYKNKSNIDPIIGKNCNIHGTVVLDVDGLKVVNTPQGDKIQFKHTGNVVIGDNVEIGPYTVIHRGTMDSTIIEDGCKIAALNNIGHNCRIGKNTIIAANVILNGGVNIGNNCWISSGAMIKHYINICNNVVIGLGSIVLKDITKPGIYVGSPARYIKSIIEGWNF